jgi:hypothetical protein
MEIHAMPGRARIRFIRKVSILPGLAQCSMVLMCMLTVALAGITGVASERRGQCSYREHGEGLQSLPENTQENG